MSIEPPKGTASQVHTGSYKSLFPRRRRLPVYMGPSTLLWCSAACAGQSVPVPEATAHVLKYTHICDIFWVVNHLLMLAIPAMFLFLGWSAALRTKCSHLARQNRFWTVALVVPYYTLATELLLLPVSYVRFELLKGYRPGPQRHTASEWLSEQIGTVLIELVAAPIIAWILYELLSRSLRWWWLWSALMVSPIVLFILILQPFWVSPLTSQYAPLNDKALIAEMDQMANRCGVRKAEIYIGGDDYQVAGLGPTKRILISSHYAEQFSPQQLRFLIGHELGHNLNGDNWKAWAAISLCLLLTFCLTEFIGKAATSRWHRQFSFSSLSDPASLPLIVFFLFAFFTLLTPLDMLWSRQIEHEADRFGLELTHENHAAASMFAGFEQTYLESPDPGWFALATRWNHPPLVERIPFANNYHPWLEGKPLEFAAECKMP